MTIKLIRYNNEMKIEWCRNEVTGVEWSDMMEQSEVSQCGLRIGSWNKWNMTVWTADGKLE